MPRRRSPPRGTSALKRGRGRSARARTSPWRALGARRRGARARHERACSSRDSCRPCAPPTTAPGQAPSII
jgi:hypothetical protein